jgi:exopolysaccharide biosynthesis polyprenyl glycosylphosphotransferase
MSKKTEILIVLLADLLALCLAWYAYFLVRVQSGWIDIALEPEFWLPMAWLCLFWVIVFFVTGLYRPWYAASRLDELTLLFKTISFGCLFLFFVVFVDDQGTNVYVSSRLLIAIYWAILLLFTASGRMAVRSLQRKLLISGIGVHHTLIVGTHSNAHQLYDDVSRYPALGFKVVGFVETGEGIPGNSEYRGTPVVGTVNDLGTLVRRHGVSELLIALDSADHNRLLDIIGKADSTGVGMKIIPDLYDIISGQARTNQIYGFPLIDINPHLMRPWEESMKRGTDIVVSLVVLLVGLPLWVLIAVLIRLDSRGAVFYKQERVGKDGETFNILKFRSMVQDAEKGGAQWAEKQDPRVTSMGKILRKLHLDEVPQFINVLRGEMSLIGPRPERPVFVEELAQQIPLYKRRLKVRPGITGWAQVKHTYDESIEDVRKKVQYDLFYIENISLRMDMKIIASTMYHMLLGKGR